MSRESNLLKNTGLYAVGSFGSKVLVYLMVLIYSYYINPEELGYYDLVMTTTTMILPIVILSINEGMYRFVVTSDKVGREKIIGTSMKFIFAALCIADILFVAGASIYPLQYKWYIAIYSFSLIMYSSSQDIVRGVGNSKLYATIGVVNSIIMLVVEILLIVVMNLGVQALLLSKIVANIISIFILMLCQSELRSIYRYKFDKSTLIDLLKYSLPLIPNTICWWVVNSSDRYIILGYLGKEQNGIYMMANKFPTVITSITGVFYLAWQQTALKEYNSPQRDYFFSNIFEKYSDLLLTLCACAIPATKLVFRFVGDAYSNAWVYTGFLYIAVVFSSLSSFLGLGYQISKETGRNVYTSVIAASINIIVNIILIKQWGLHAASFSTFCAFIVLFVIRIFHTKRYFVLKVSWLKLCILFIGVILAMLGTTFLNEIWEIGVILFGTFLIMLYINKDLLGKFVAKIINKKRN